MNKLKLSADFLNSYDEARKGDIIEALKLFRDGGKYIITNKKKNTHIVVSKSEKRLIECLIELVVSGLLIALPEELDKMNKKIETLKFDKNRKFYNQILSQIFDYEKFKKDEAWNWSKNSNDNKIKRETICNIKGRDEYLNELNIDCCPYCNRSYIMKREILVKPYPDKPSVTKTINPVIDHYWSKSDYPYLAISVHNLIPSCNLCNSIIKHTNELQSEYHIHPYTHSFHKKIKFVVVPQNVNAFNDSPDDFSIEIQEKPHRDSHKAREYADFFGLESLYNNHKDYAAEILLKKQAYNEDWLAGINSLEGLNMAKNAAKRYYYGNYLQEKEINKRPLSKFTIDLVEGDFEWFTRRLKNSSNDCAGAGNNNKIVSKRKS